MYIPYSNLSKTRNIRNRNTGMFLLFFKAQWQASSGKWQPHLSQSINLLMIRFIIRNIRGIHTPRKRLTPTRPPNPPL